MNSFSVGKSKSKKKAQANLEFFSPLPMDECVRRLKKFPGTENRFPIITRVKVTKVDDEIWEFSIHKSYFGMLSAPRAVWQRNRNFNGEPLYLQVRAKGHLRSIQANSALVFGKADTARKTYIVSSLVFLPFFLLVISFAVSLFTASPYIAIGIAVIFIPLLAYWAFYKPMERGEQLSSVLLGHIKHILQR